MTLWARNLKLCKGLLLGWYAIHHLARRRLVTSMFTTLKIMHRLVVKRYTNEEGLDFVDTFSRAAKLTIVKILLGIAAKLNWTLTQFSHSWMCLIPFWMEIWMKRFGQDTPDDEGSKPQDLFMWATHLKQQKKRSSICGRKNNLLLCF